ncbi:MAG: MBL fold metallo-hydrolase [Acidimicrobiales bacterium]
MRVTFWGTRGSIAKAGPTTVRYGGNTSCVEVCSDAGTLVVIDCGTGAHGLGEELLARADGKPIEGHLLISHTHWDHIQGLPFFAPLFEPHHTWHVYGPRGLSSSVSETLAGQMQYSYFPLSLEQLEADVDYHDLIEGSFFVDDINVTARYLNHPALTLGYRLEVDGAVLVYASDHEPHRRDLAGGGDVEASRPDRTHVDFLRDADLVVHDAQYCAAEYTDKAGWGHSTVEYVVDAARQGNVSRLALFHHDPGRTDAALDDLLALAREHGAAAGSTTEIFGASEGQSIVLQGSSAASTHAEATAISELDPALADAGRSVLIAVRDPDIADTLRTAATDEGLEIFETTDHRTALHIARRDEPSLILLEEDPETGTDVLELAQAIRALDPPYGGDVGLVTISGHAPTAAASALTDWMIWPASAVYVRTKMHAWLLRRAIRWQNAPLPPDEDRRVQSLHDLDVLDTEPEGRFDRYTQLASRAFDVPVALISLVDTGRQWFKSRHGLDTTETPRDMAFCAHAILDGDVLQVPDALVDPRFADNPLVADGPRVRFYAGVPLTLTDGTQAGTLCVIDYRPRLLDDSQLDELRRLGGMVVEELERR